MSQFARLAEKWDAFLSLVEKTVRWGPVMAAVIAGGGASWAASVSNWLSSFGPIAWYAAGLLAAALFIVIYWLWCSAQLLSTKRSVAKAHSVNFGRINPLESHFRTERIQLSTFSNPFYEANKDKHFYQCHIYGPASILVVNSALRHCRFAHCDTVLIDLKKGVRTPIVFEESTFEKCTFYNVCVFVPESEKQKFEAGMKGLTYLNPDPQESQGGQDGDG